MFIDHCGNVGIRPANTNFLLHAIFYGTHDDESGVSSRERLCSIPVLGAVGASYGTNGIAVDNFIYPKNGETVTFMDNSVNTESFLNGLKDENQVNMDFGTQVLSGGWYAGKGFWTVDVSIKGLANIRAPKTLFEFMKRVMDLRARMISVISGRMPRLIWRQV